MKLYADIHGSAQTATPVLMIHGLGASSNIWGPQAALLSRFHPVYCPDTRGTGRSEVADTTDIAAIVDDLLAFMDEHQLARAHIVAHSLGTAIATHLATLHPERVASLALVGPIHALPDAARAAMRDRAQAVRAHGMVAVADATVQAGTSAQTRAHRPEVAAFVREMVMAQSPEGYAQNCEAIADLQPAAIENLDCPTLVATGDEDNTAPIAVARLIAGKIAHAQLRVLTRCGHWTPIECAEELSRILLQFIVDAA